MVSARRCWPVTRAEAFAAPTTVVRRVVGTATEKVVPFGAFRALLADAAITETGRPAELLRAAQEHLTGDGASSCFVVDDAHHLDHLSATLVYQLALSGVGAADRHGPARGRAAGRSRGAVGR